MRSNHPAIDRGSSDRVLFGVQPLVVGDTAELASPCGWRRLRTDDPSFDERIDRRIGSDVVDRHLEEVVTRLGDVRATGEHRVTVATAEHEVVALIPSVMRMSPRIRFEMRWV